MKRRPDAERIVPDWAETIAEAAGDPPAGVDKADEADFQAMCEKNLLAVPPESGWPNDQQEA